MLLLVLLVVRVYWRGCGRSAVHGGWVGSDCAVTKATQVSKIMGYFLNRGRGRFLGKQSIVSKQTDNRECVGGGNTHIYRGIHIADVPLFMTKTGTTGHVFRSKRMRDANFDIN